MYHGGMCKLRLTNRAVKELSSGSNTHGRLARCLTLRSSDDHGRGRGRDDVAGGAVPAPPVGSGDLEMALSLVDDLGVLGRHGGR